MKPDCEADPMPAQRFLSTICHCKQGNSSSWWAPSLTIIPEDTLPTRLRGFDTWGFLMRLSPEMQAASVTLKSVADLMKVCVCVVWLCVFAFVYRRVCRLNGRL